MQCAFCGTENRPEHKFCAMCGVKLERRKVERRVHPSGIGVKCDSCGHLNEPGYKFCGMCGTRIERRLHERRAGGGEAARAAAPANAQLPTPEGKARAMQQRPAGVATADLPEPGARRGDPAIFRNAPRTGNGSQISGPSFLGLDSQPEGSGEYLLEDEPSRGGLRRLILLLILAAILGLAFVQWRSSFKANPKPPPAKTEPAPSPAPQGNNQAPAPANPDQPAKESSSGSANAGAAAKDEAKSKTEAENPLAAVVPTAAAAPSGDTSDADEKNAPDGDRSPPAADAKVPEETHLPDHKPSTALLRAQQYLQGRGVPQNCEQGLLYLRAAAEKNDPGAAIQMAALYSSGHCVKQDRVMAYRWFNSAHELEPANSWIQRNMDQLWGQMTSQERRLAGY